MKLRDIFRKGVIFSKTKPIKEDLIEFSGQNVGTGQVGAYIHELYKQCISKHLGYYYYNRDGDLRFVIYTIYPASNYTKLYFKDRCPAIVEQECRKLEGMAHKFVQWPNGFEEVQFN